MPPALETVASPVTPLCLSGTLRYVNTSADQPRCREELEQAATVASEHPQHLAHADGSHWVRNQFLNSLAEVSTGSAPRLAGRNCTPAVIATMLLSTRGTRCCIHCCLSTFVSKTRGRALQTSAKACARSLIGQTQVLALPSGPCFDPSCQQKLDQAFSLSIALPLVLALFAFLLLSRKPRQGQKDLQDHADALERDISGNLALRAVSYTAWPVTFQEEGERLRLDVGPVDRKVKRTFVFKRYAYSVT